MTVADPISPAFALVYSTLSADSTFMSYVSSVEQDMLLPAAYTKPYCVMQMQSPPIDTNSATGYRMLSRGIITVKIVGKASDGAAIRSAFAQADSLLCPNGRPRRVSDNNSGALLDIYRGGTLSYSEVVSGEKYIHLGGLYRYEV